VGDVIRFSEKGSVAENCAAMLESLATSIREGTTTPEAMVLIWEQDGDPMISYYCETTSIGVGLCQFASSYLIETHE